MKFPVAFLLLSICASARAQYVSIPDNNFVTWLAAHGYGTCMSGNQLDTTCAGVLLTMELEITQLPYAISDLTGIQYFDNVDTVECSGIGVAHIPALPPRLRYLNCKENLLDSLPPLPDTLKFLICHGNSLAALPDLPDSLRYLSCGDNELTALPQLPDSVFYLECSQNNLTMLSNLPDGLRQLFCSENNLDTLSNLPTGLRKLHCNDAGLTSITYLPDSLTVLLCVENNLTSLPPLPGKLWVLNCMDNALDSLPALPPSLESLYCANNNLAEIPALPDALDVFHIANNPLITCLPPLHAFTGSGWAFSIEGTAVTCLPILPQHQGYHPAIDTMPLCQNGNPGGCDVYCGPASSDTMFAEVCPGELFHYNQYSMNATGTYAFELISASGCDSIFVVNLTVDTPGSGIVVNSNVLSANGGVTYQWYDCVSNIPIVGATNETFATWWNGWFSVLITGPNGCVGMSDCVEVTGVGIATGAQERIRIAPNPARDFITIGLPASQYDDVSITDVTGRIVLRPEPGRQPISVGRLSPGIYFVRCYFDQRQKFVGTLLLEP